jgi:hypothetical protein
MSSFRDYACVYVCVYEPMNQGNDQNYTQYSEIRAGDHSRWMKPA